MISLELAFLEPLGRLNARPWADAVTGVKIDSRKIDEGDLFVAIGPGADFTAHALARGAAAVLAPEDAHAALGAIGGEVRTRSSARIVAMTGSTGKTTTKDILAALCAPHLRTIASEANFNNELGVPLTLCRIEPDTELCIVEMGMRGVGQIAWLASFAKPDIGVISNSMITMSKGSLFNSSIARSLLFALTIWTAPSITRMSRKRSAAKGLGSTIKNLILAKSIFTDIPPPLYRRRRKTSGAIGASPVIHMHPRTAQEYLRAWTIEHMVSKHDDRCVSAARPWIEGSTSDHA